jgi:ribosome-associated protein
VADDLRVNNWLVIPAGELRERFSRSSGPGGQSVNTADTRVELSFDVAHSAALPEYARARALERLSGRLSDDGVLTVVASEQRSQLLNRRAARGRLAAQLREAIAPPPRQRVPTRPGRAAKERRIAEKRQRGAVKRNRRLDIRDTD